MKIMVNVIGVKEIINQTIAKTDCFTPHFGHVA